MRSNTLNNVTPLIVVLVPTVKLTIGPWHETDFVVYEYWRQLLIFASSFLTTIMVPPLFLLVSLLTTLPFVASQTTALPSSFPHAYPGQPNGDFSPTWQKCMSMIYLICDDTLKHANVDFLVTQPLPNITFKLPRTYAGNIPVQRAGHPNDTLFFLGFEKSTGSLTAPASKFNKEPWGIWLNGGWGSPPTN